MARCLSSRRRAAAGAALVVGVLALHAALLQWAAEASLGWGAASSVPPPRLQVSFVREVLPTAAPPVAVVTAKPPPRRRVARPAPAAQPASAPEAPAVAPLPDEPAPPEPALAAAPSEPASAPEAPPEPVADAASAPDWPTRWPASTRLDYALTGWFRGPLHGEARVEWLRDGLRYQVHLDVSIGPSFAPMMTRTMSSHGRLSADGLLPERYDERTRVGFAAPRRVAIVFEPDAVVLPGERRRVRWPGMQDAASQFVQLTWLFTTQPGQLVPGHSVEVPLALPRATDRWRYDVQETETLALPFGALPVLHLKPRRLTRADGDMVMEAWFAPTLLYLPVRIRIHQDAETWIDLQLQRAPLQARDGGE